MQTAGGVYTYKVTFVVAVTDLHLQSYVRVRHKRNVCKQTSSRRNLIGFVPGIAIILDRTPHSILGATIEAAGHFFAAQVQQGRFDPPMFAS
jgi:hypothetical protein